MKEESERAGLTLNIQKAKIMASSPITPLQIDRETLETVKDLIVIYLFIYLFIFGSKIATDGDCSHEIKRRLLLERKAMINPSSVQFSHSVISDCLQPHGLQCTRTSCLSPFPGVFPNSYPLSW